jgi:hypothetical protein
MTNKISFAVENIEEVQENPNSSFAHMKVDFFASGDNAHNLYVSEDTLRKTAETIYNVPVVWKYDSKTDDAGSHDEGEYAIGVIREGSKIEEKKLTDGRTMLSVPALIWKKYSGRLIDIFKRDKKKAVSVEMSVLDALDENGRQELLDYRFEAITILGKYINPAIPLAEMTVLSFAEEQREFENIYEREFSHDKYSGIDFKIPQTLKSSLEKAIENFTKLGKGGNSVSLSNAKFLLKNETITPDKVRLMYKKLSSYSKKSILEDDEKIRFELWGGESFSWIKSVHEEMEKIDNKRSAFFVYEDDKERKEEISVEDKEEKTENMAIPEVEEKEEEPKKEEMAEPPVEEKKEEMAVEPPVEDKKEEEAKVKMSLDSYLDLPFILRLLEEITEGEESFLEQDNFAIKCATDEMKKDGEKSFESISKGMFAKMKMMSSKMAKMAEENKAYMSMKEEFESLKAFKKSVEEARFSFEVESTLKEVEPVMPKEELEKAREESKNFSLENIDGWKNGVKAKAYTFSSGKSKEIKNEIPRWSYNIETKGGSKEALWTLDNK